MSDISSALYNIYTPPGLSQSGYTGTGKVPKTLNWNFAIERELPSDTLLTVSYVGSISRHLIYLNMMNEPAYGSGWLPWTQDPTRTPAFNGTTTLPINYYRPYRGIGTMNLYGSGGSTNYNALQVQVQKRMSRKLSYGVAYTWSKAMGLGSTQWSWSNPWNRREYDYTRVSFDRTQVMTANFVYFLPSPGRNGNFLDHKGLRLVLNGWQVTGIVTAQTGTPVTFGHPGFATDGSNVALRWTGQPTFGPRAVVTNWRLPGSGMTELSQFNVNAIRPANIPSVGLDSGLGYWSNPTTFISSPEISFMKNVHLTEDGKKSIQLRVEAYNLLNHHDWTGRNMGATFQSPTNLTLTNLPTEIATQNAGGVYTQAGGRFGFGALNGAVTGRRIQLNMKVYF
jgi:hypothetical protein